MGREKRELMWFFASVVWCASLAFSISHYVLFNDHFDRISRARQIAQYGAMPFRDFFDPGYFLTTFSSAWLQRLLGDTLLGELWLNTTFIATGVTIVFMLVSQSVGVRGATGARRAMGVVVGVVAAALTLLAMPRPYDYDKVLFYPLGVALCWWYVERPSHRRAMVMGVALVTGALFRYDTGIYIGCAALVAMVVLHAREPRVLMSRAGVLAAAAAAVALPFLIAVQVQAGLADAADQIVTYALREGERTQLSTWQRFVPVEHADESAPWLSVLWHAENASVVLYYVLHALPVAAVVGLVASWRASREETAKVLSLAAMCVLLNLFILRSPVPARIGGMAGPLVILAVYVVVLMWRARHGVLGWILRAGAAGLVLLAVVSLSAAVEWTSHVRPRRAVAPSYLRYVVERAGMSPPSMPAFYGGPTVGMVQYLRECTSPRDRVFATWFVPELYFFAQRGFAAGMVVTFGGHWSEPRFDARSAQMLDAESVPIVIVRARDNGLSRYPSLRRYIGDHYHKAGETDFQPPTPDAQLPRTVSAEEASYMIFVRNDRQPAGTHLPTSLPCF